ncbi:MAG: DUF4166 domain-containing protein [Planctomycetota bacterium]|jgi:hypothetical protein|nr:DUF4166 domain-containing protein [Planctomycetota bacterium]
MNLYGRIRGMDWSQVDPTLQALHLSEEDLDTRGRFRVTRSRNVLARMIGRWMNLPPAGDPVEVHIHVQREHNQETWTRNFSGAIFKSWQTLDPEGMLVERFGRFEFRFHVETIPQGIHFRQTDFRMRIGRGWMPLPPWLSTRIEATETISGHSAHPQVEVDISIPIFGSILRYDGTLEPPGE